jgi:hypothetical protein
LEHGLIDAGSETRVAPQQPILLKNRHGEVKELVKKMGRYEDSERSSPAVRRDPPEISQ